MNAPDACKGKGAKPWTEAIPFRIGPAPWGSTKLFTGHGNPVLDEVKFSLCH